MTPLSPTTSAQTLQPAPLAAPDGADILLALENRQWDRAKTLTAEGAVIDIVAIQSRIISLLILAASANQQAEADILGIISVGFALDDDAILVQAVAAGCRRIVDYLIRKRGDVNLANANGVRLLFLAVFNAQISLDLIRHPSFRVNDPIIPKFSKDSPLAIALPPAYRKMYPLHAAVYFNLMPVLQELVQIPGVDLECRNASKQTPFMVAVDLENWDKALVLVQAGASCDVFSNDHIEKIDNRLEELFEQGQDFRNAGDKELLEGCSEEIIAWLKAVDDSDDWGEHMFFLSLNNGNLSVAEYFVWIAEVGVNEPIYEMAKPLYYAVFYEDVASLIIHHHDFELEEPLTPLPSAHASLLEDMDPDDLGCYPIHVVAARGSLALLEDLIEKKANVNRLDGKGRTALDLATQKGRNEHAELLIKAGGKTAAALRDC